MGKINNKDNIATSVLLGVGIAILICLVSTGGLAHLLLTEKIGEGSTEVCVTVVLLLSSILGNLIAVRFWAKQRILVIVINSTVLFSVLLLSGLMMDGGFHNVLIRMGSILVGALVSSVLYINRRGKPARRKSHNR